jgi:thioredoxin-dependent peroxiredoxin
MAWFWSNPLPTGTPAPDFSALDDSGQPVTLSGLRGNNVVLIFYPGDDTKVCRLQLAEFRDRARQAQGRNTLLFGVNPGDAQSHSSFRRKIRLPFPLLIDKGRAIARAYQSNGLMMIKRTVYLIGPDGIIRYAQRGKPAVEEVLATAA